jgi:cytochrome c
MKKLPSLAAAAALMAAAMPALADKNDDAMRALAAKSGCTACHQVDPGAKGPDGLAPVGPAWRDVAAKYKGQKGADAQLVHVVLTGSSPYDSHWKGKVSGLAMPPNKVAISEPDAKKLVSWILALGPAK